MFVLRSLAKSLLPGGQPETPGAGSSGGMQDLMQLSCGRISSSSPSSLPPNAESVEYVLALRKTSVPFNYQLVLSPASYNSDKSRQQDAGLEDDLDDGELVSLVDKSMCFFVTHADATHAFHWTCADGETKITFTIKDSIVNKVTADLFELAVLECMFERAFQKPRHLASEADLELLKYDPAAPPSKCSQKPLYSSSSEEKELVRIQAGLYVYDASKAQFLEQAPVATSTITERAPFTYWLNIFVKNQLILSQPIENEMNPVFNNEYKSFIWVYRDDVNNVCHSWSLKFTSALDEGTFKQAFGKCMYETLNREAFEKTKAEDHQFLTDAYTEDVEMQDAFADPEEASDEESRSSPDEDEDSESGEDKPGFGGTLASESKSAKNSQLAVGYNCHRSFVVRGNKIGVFKHDVDGLEYATTINNVQTTDGTPFSPAKVMLHDRDSSMVMFNSNKPNSLFKMDLEYGKVVEEWDVDENRDIVDFTHDSKYAQMTPQKTLVGVSHNAIFRIDPRLSGKKIVDTEVNQYKSKNEFRCATTTGKGELAVASDKGDIRLYNKLNIRAKTHLPGLGDAILGLDVTEDGKYILATCKTYLLVLCTEGSKDAKSYSGFAKSLGSDKPIPRRLQLRPEHVVIMNEPVHFTPARFNTGEGGERTIVTSSGPYLITWNFRRVKQGKLYDYSIKKYPDRVVAENFQYGTDAKVIVTLPDDVNVMTPSKKMPKNLRDSIVNSPF